MFLHLYLNLVGKSLVDFHCFNKFLWTSKNYQYFIFCVSLFVIYVIYTQLKSIDCHLVDIGNWMRALMLIQILKKKIDWEVLFVCFCLFSNMSDHWRAYYKCSYCNKEYTSIHFIDTITDAEKSLRLCPYCRTDNTPKTICK